MAGKRPTQHRGSDQPSRGDPGAGSPAQDERPTWRTALAIGAPLLPVLVALAVFLPTLPFEFLHYDEQHQLVHNPLVRSLGWDNLVRIFTSFSITNYYPVRVLSFAVDHAIWGMRPGGFRLTNVLLHAANTLLVFALTWRIIRAGGPSSDGAGWWAATVAAGLFALHPVVVEPVVWISGREELLMVFFALACTLFHIRAQNVRPGTGAALHRTAFHGLAALSAACACTSNVVGAAVPLLIVAYDLAIQRSLRGAVTRTWFLWLISIGAVVAKKAGDRVARDLGVLTEEGLHLGIVERLRAVFDGYWLNVKALLWPADLVAIYPKTVPPSLGSPTVLLGLLLAGATLVLLWAVRRNRVVLFGLLWFLAGLAPSSQIIPHHIHHADRFLYLPLVGVALALGIVAKTLLESRLPRALPAALFVIVFLAMTLRSTLQTRVWRDTETLFAHNVALYPDVPDARNNLGLALAGRGNWPRAYEHLSNAVRLKPQDPEMQFNIGVIQRHLGDLDSAAGHLEEAIRLQPAMKDAHYQMAEVRVAQNRRQEAIACLREELQISNSHADAHQLLAVLLTDRGEAAEAIRHYREALRLRPGWPTAANNLAWLLATGPDPRFRDGPEAVRLAEGASRIIGDRDAQAFDTLAAAYAEAGRFDEAATAARKAIAIATLQENRVLQKEIEARLALYVAHRPYRTPPATSAAGS